MALFTLSFTLGVWLLQQQATLPDFVWALGLPVLALSLLITTGNSYVGTGLMKPLARSYNVPFVLKISRFVLIAIFALGIGFYHAAWQAEQRLSISLPDAWQGRDIEVTGVVAELPRNHEHGLRFRFDVEQVLTPLASVPPHVYLSTYFDAKIQPLNLHAGERWQLTLRLKQPHGTSNPHGFDFEAWALENNIRAVGYVHNKGHNTRLDTLADGLSYRIESWRELVRNKFETSLGNAPFVGVLSALAIGDQSSIPQTQWQVFTRTGVNHLMSIT